MIAALDRESWSPANHGFHRDSETHVVQRSAPVDPAGMKWRVRPEFETPGHARLTAACRPSIFFVHSGP